MPRRNVNSAAQHPVDLVSVLLRSAADRIVVASLLDRAGRCDTPALHVDTAQLAHLARHRVVGLIPHHWTVESDRSLTNMQRRSAMHLLRLDAELASVARHFAEAGIEMRVLKGLASSKLDYEVSGVRTTADVDLLVPPGDLPRAVRVLAEHGGTGVNLDSRSLRLSKSATIDVPSGLQVDLHSQINRFGEQSEDELFRDPVALPASNAFGLPTELRLLHAASHLMYTPPGLRRISGLADISAIRASHRVDWGEMQQSAKRLGIERVAGFGLRLEREIRGLDLAELNSWESPTRLEEMSMLRSDRRLLMEHALALSCHDSWRARGLYLRHWTIPTGDQLRIRGGIAGYFRRALPQTLGGQNLDRVR